jgi:hypothetical protein
MKKDITYFSVLFFLFIRIASAQIGIGTTNIDPSSVMDLKGVNQGILLPRMTNDEIQALKNPALGLIIYNTEAQEIQTNNGTLSSPIWLTRPMGSTGLTGPVGLQGANGVVVYVSTAQNGVISFAGATIAGGISNTASGPDSTVAGGQSNTTSGNYSTASGNISNATGISSTIVGGSYNAASQPGATIGGGVANVSSGANGTVVGGYTNVASMPGSTTVGGDKNTSSNAGTTLVGGSYNTSSGVNSTVVGGGALNTADGVTSTITGGGILNAASAVCSTVSGGGTKSGASGVDSTVTGGIDVFAPSFGEWAGGLHGTKYVFNSASAAMALDRAFSIGIGTSTTDLKEGLLILKNGTSTLPNTSIALITAGSDKSIITKEFLEYKQIKIISGATYTLLQSDCDFILHFTNDDLVTPVTVSIPSGLKISSRFEGKQIGLAKISFVPETTSIVHTQSKDKSKTAGQYSTFKMNWLATDEYLLTGKLESITVQ